MGGWILVEELPYRCRYLGKERFLQLRLLVEHLVPDEDRRERPVDVSVERLEGEDPERIKHGPGFSVGTVRIRDGIDDIEHVDDGARAERRDRDGMFLRADRGGRVVMFRDFGGDDMSVRSQDERGDLFVHGDDPPERKGRVDLTGRQDRELRLIGAQDIGDEVLRPESG